MRVDIVGAGPAGLAVALNLKHDDPDGVIDVHVWDRNPAVTTTPCGEGIHYDRLDLLPGFDSDASIGARTVGAAVDAPGCRRLIVDMQSATMDRSRWLPAMAERLAALGTTFHVGAFLSENEIRALPGDVVVGADGPSSRVARIVGNERQFMPAMQVRYDATPSLDRLLIFRFDPEYSTDYAWVFPRGDHTSVGTLAPATAATYAQMDSLARHYGVEGRVLAKESYPIPFGGTKAAAGRYALVGDAAGVANPMTKGGMAPAFHQAQLLANALQNGGVPSYEQTCRDHPLYSSLPKRGLDVMHRLTVADVHRVLGSGQTPLRLRAFTNLELLARAAVNGRPRPRFWRDVFVLMLALRHALKWGW